MSLTNIIEENYRAKTINKELVDNCVEKHMQRLVELVLCISKRYRCTKIIEKLSRIGRLPTGARVSGITVRT